MTGVLVLDRAGEYIEDTKDQHENTVFGLQHHPHAPDRMVVLSRRKQFREMYERGEIASYMEPIFNIKDIDLIDLIDFYTGFTEEQRRLLRDYAHIPDIYSKLLKETPFGLTDKRDWFQTFPGLFDLKDAGKKLLREFEKSAVAETRSDLTDEELEKLNDHLGGSTVGVLERAIRRIKRFCQNPFFGAKARGADILAVPTCVNKVIKHLEQGRVVFIDLRGIDDDNYTLISALFIRRLLTENKQRDDLHQIRTWIVMEEAHNILSEAELYKGVGSGSVFIELAREGRKFKLGFALVTQHPDAERSIAAEIANTIDTVVAFHMSPENAKSLTRLKSGFAGLELQLANANVFEGIAISDAGPVSFRSVPITPEYMKKCVDGQLEDYLNAQVPLDCTNEEEASLTLNLDEGGPNIESRLSRLMRQRAERNQYQDPLCAAMENWAHPSGENEEILDEEDT